MNSIFKDPREEFFKDILGFEQFNFDICDETNDQIVFVKFSEKQLLELNQFSRLNLLNDAIKAGVIFYMFDSGRFKKLLDLFINYQSTFSSSLALLLLKKTLNDSSYFTSFLGDTINMSRHYGKAETRLNLASVQSVYTSLIIKCVIKHIDKRIKELNDAA